MWIEPIGCRCKRFSMPSCFNWSAPYLSKKAGSFFSKAAASAFGCNLINELVKLFPAHILFCRTYSPTPPLFIVINILACIFDLPRLSSTIPVTLKSCLPLSSSISITLPTGFSCAKSLSAVFLSNTIVYGCDKTFCGFPFVK